VSLTIPASKFQIANCQFTHILSSISNNRKIIKTIPSDSHKKIAAEKPRESLCMAASLQLALASRRSEKTPMQTSRFAEPI
jgi:hypothetical protein